MIIYRADSHQDAEKAASPILAALGAGYYCRGLIQTTEDSVVVIVEPVIDNNLQIIHIDHSILVEVCAVTPS
jgi:hypothetical protein